MTMIKPEFYWKITNPDGGDDAFNLVVAPNIEEAIRIYLSQYDYLHMEDITRIERLGSVLVNFGVEGKAK